MIGSYLFAGSSNKKPVTKKLQAPVQVTASKEGIYPTNTKTPFTATIVPPANCSNLNVKIYGVDGVQIYGISQKNYASCAQVTHSVEVLVPPKTYGLVVVQVSYTNSSGKPESAVKTFIARTADAQKPDSKIGQKSTVGNYRILPTE
ncbi:MAG: hypothetical protein D6767_00060 [Candidatus Hydrogenedentota bacterium]|nr:MAG: hypothetical protein D6767_00060 [Candidatus Hydrogenedentota bacterium]